MRAMFWIGVVVLILGIVSLVAPIPSIDRGGFKAGVSAGAETRNAGGVSPIASAVMILGGLSTMAAGKTKSKDRLA